jgi:hypothetical protein
MSAYTTQAVIAVDDTDTLQSGGTGSVARALANYMQPRFAIRGVTRHQLAVLPGINYTKKNSTNVVHLLEFPPDPEGLADELCEWLANAAEKGAEPGLCIADVSAVAGHPLGSAAQQRVVKREESRAAAREAGVILRHAREGDGGIIGAFSGSCLASGQDDGRFVQIGSLRELSGRLAAADIRAAGVDEIRTVDEEILEDVVILAGKFRPAMKAGGCVLYCVPDADGNWTPVKGHKENLLRGV